MSLAPDCSGPAVRGGRREQSVALETVLVLMARAPERGRVKTRLAEALGDDGALGVYLALLDRTSAAAREWSGRVELHIDGDAALVAHTALWWCPMIGQASGGLGRRLAFACRRALYAGRRPVIVGTDCAVLAAAHIRALASSLDVASVAIGPAADGGYWGIAISDPAAVDLCFSDDLPWSTDRLLDATRARLEAAGLPHVLGPTLEDIDDLVALRRAEERGFRWSPAAEPPPPASPPTRRRPVRSPGS